METEESRNITIAELKAWHDHIREIAPMLDMEKDAMEEMLSIVYGKCFTGLRTVGQIENIYEVSIKPNNVSETILFAIGKKGDDMRVVSNKIKIIDSNNNQTYITLHQTDTDTNAQYTHLRVVPESIAETKRRLKIVRESLTKARWLKSTIESKVCNLAISLELMAQVLKEDDELHIGITRIDSACDLIDFDCGPITMTICRRHRENNGEPYWSVSTLIEIWDEDENITGPMITLIDFGRH